MAAVCFLGEFTALALLLVLEGWRRKTFQEIGDPFFDSLERADRLFETHQDRSGIRFGFAPTPR